MKKFFINILQKCRDAAETVFAFCGIVNMTFESLFTGPFHWPKRRNFEFVTIASQIMWMLLYHFTTAYYWVGIGTFPLAVALVLLVIWMAIATIVLAVYILDQLSWNSYHA